MQDQVTNLLISYATQIPLFAAWFLGALWAVVRWQRHPGVSVLVLLAITILAVNLVVGLAPNFLMPQMVVDAIEQSDLSGEQINQTIMLAHQCIFTVSAVFGAIAYGLLFWAMFRWRTDASGD